jgi:hypothetical protein
MIPPRRRSTKWRVDSCRSNISAFRPLHFSQISISVTTLLTHLLDVVVAQSPAILELLSGKNKTLLVWWDSLLVLNLALHIVDGVTGLDLEGDGLARQGLYEAVVAYLLVACSKRYCGSRYLSQSLGTYICTAILSVLTHQRRSITVASILIALTVVCFNPVLLVVAVEGHRQAGRIGVIVGCLLG